MKKRETRWYRLWYFAAGMWLVTFCGNLANGYAETWILVMQFLNAVLSLGAGIVNRRRYKKRNP